jgi:hypothetical protein
MEAANDRISGMSDNYFQTAIESFQLAIESLGPRPEGENPALRHLATGLVSLTQGLQQHEEHMHSLLGGFARTQPEKK